jgi:hypothetical protein
MTNSGSGIAYTATLRHWPFAKIVSLDKYSSTLTTYTAITPFYYKTYAWICKKHAIPVLPPG